MTYTENRERSQNHLKGLKVGTQHENSISQLFEVARIIFKKRGISTLLFEQYPHKAQ